MAFGDDEPHVAQKYVDSDKVEGTWKIWRPIGADDVADETVISLHSGGLHLNAKALRGVLDDEVVGGGLSPGLANVKAFFGGARHKAHLHPLAALLGRLEV
jgi:hypothetical protein